MTHRARLLGRGDENQFIDAPRLRFRRALLLWLMTLVVPGSAQLKVGRRWVGAIGVTVWLALVGGVVALWWRARSDRAGVINFLTAADTITYLRIGIAVIAVGWLALFVDAWRLAGPRRLNWPRAVVVAVLNLAIIAGVAGSAAYASRLLQVTDESIEQVFPEDAPTSAPLEGRYNLLLIGSDSGPERTGIRPDSLTVASIDTTTGATVLVSLPRNLQNVPFPEDSPMHQVYPNGYNCGTTCLINAVHTAAAGRTDLYPDSKDPGLDATMDAVTGATGLKINYYLMVNLKGFRTLINALGGVEIDVKTRIAMFGHDDSWKNTWIEPGLQTLDGQQALWYARSRVQSDDYTRMGRQKCLLAAMADQLDPTTVVTRAVAIAKSGRDLLSGNMPRKELGQFADLALKSRGQKIQSVSLVPPLVDVQNPNYELIRSSIKTIIKRSERRAEKSATSAPTPDTTPDSGKASPKPSSSASVDPFSLSQEERDKLLQRTANNSRDVAASC